METNGKYCLDGEMEERKCRCIRRRSYWLQELVSYHREWITDSVFTMRTIQGMCVDEKKCDKREKKTNHQFHCLGDATTNLYKD